MQESVTDATAREPTKWSRSTCVFFRFTFAYFVLFALPFVEMFVPCTAWLARGIDGGWYRIAPWVGKHLLGMTQTISVSELSSGDRATDYIAFLCVGVRAASRYSSS